MTFDKMSAYKMPCQLITLCPGINHICAGCEPTVNMADSLGPKKVQESKLEIDRVTGRGSREGEIIPPGTIFPDWIFFPPLDSRSLNKVWPEQDKKNFLTIFILLVPVAGFEPWTSVLRVECLTTMLQGHSHWRKMLFLAIFFLPVHVAGF